MPGLHERRGTVLRRQRARPRPLLQASRTDKVPTLHHQLDPLPPARRSRPLPARDEELRGFLRAELREIVQPRLVIGVGKFAKASLLLLYPEARELNWPFRVPRARSSDSAELPYLLFPEHPYHIMTRAAPVREHYERRLARAIEWGFTLEKPAAATR
jgi:uracil-DNA glycosylase